MAIPTHLEQSKIAIKISITTPFVAITLLAAGKYQLSDKSLFRVDRKGFWVELYMAELGDKETSHVEVVSNMDQARTGSVLTYCHQVTFAGELILQGIPREGNRNYRMLSSFGRVVIEDE